MMQVSSFFVALFPLFKKSIVMLCFSWHFGSLYHPVLQSRHLVWLLSFILNCILMRWVSVSHAAYRVGRAELLEWVNSILELNYTKVEQCGNGAAYCQLFDAIYPGEVPVHVCV